MHLTSIYLLSYYSELRGWLIETPPEMNGHSIIFSTDKTVIFCSLKEGCPGSQVDHVLTSAVGQMRKPRSEKCSGFPRLLPVKGRARKHGLLLPSPQLAVFLQSSRNLGLLSASHYDRVTMETTVLESSK